MKLLPGRMLGDTGNCTRGAWRALLPLRMKILPGRTALKTLDTMALCTARLSSSLLGIISRNCNSTVEVFRMLGDMQETAGFDL